MQDAILQKVEESFQIAERFFNTTFERPKNIIFKRNGRTAGHSNYSKRELMFQLDLAEHNREDFLKQVVPHEVAHYVQRAVYGYRNVSHHGREWKYIMSRVYRLVPDRCHTYDTSVTETRLRNRFIYTCKCSEYKVSSVRHNRMVKGIQSYKCLRCNSTLVFKSPDNVTKIARLKQQLAVLENQINSESFA